MGWGGGDEVGVGVEDEGSSDEYRVADIVLVVAVSCTS